MRKIIYIVFVCVVSIIFVSNWIKASSKFPDSHQDTLDVNVMDGAWLNDSCYCDGKKTIPEEMQVAHTMFVNGNSVIQQQTGRWKKAEWNKYCSVLAESKMKKISEDRFEVTGVSEKSLSPGDTKCDIPARDKTRTWTIISLTDAQLKYESSTGCDKGPMICQFTRIDR